MNDDLETRRIRAAEARQFMANPLFREAFDGVAEALRQVAIHCDADDKEKAHRVVLSMQLLGMVRREVERRAEDGDFAEFQMKELEKRSKLRLFKR